MDQPIERKRHILSPIWTLPLLALIIGCWLLYTAYRDAGIMITIHFPDAAGITTGKTKVIYKGIPVGTVKDVAIDNDLGGVNLIVEMAKETKRGLVEDTKFWIVKPEISAGRISGLDTLLTGSYIGVQRGESTVPTTHFEGLMTAPTASADTPGLHITLESDTLYSLQRGSNIYTKNLRIGQVLDYRLDDQGKIQLQAFIEPEFSHLIKTGTKFWNASGLSINGDLQRGLSVNVESMASLIYGGIACATPEALRHTPTAGQEARFSLFRDFEAAEYGIEATLQVADGSAMVPGKTRVLFRGIKVGLVKHLEVNDDHTHTVTATMLLDPATENLLRENTRFYIQRPEVSITGIKHLEAVLTGPYITFEPGDGGPRFDFAAETGTKPRPSLRHGSRYLLTADATDSLNIGAPVLYKGIAVGEITNIVFTPDMEAIRVDIMVFSPHDQLIRTDTVFWNISGIQIDGSLSQFNINLASLQTALAGGIAFTNPTNDTGSDPDRKAESGAGFPLHPSYRQAVQSVPALQPRGLTVSLQTETLPPLKPDSPVFFNNITVGKILDIHLAENRKNVVVKALIHEKYRDLVTSASRFYNLSGISLEASLQGIDLRTGPLDSILTGGIGFFTPDGGKKVQDGHSFALYREYLLAEHASAVEIRLTLPTAKGLRRKSQIRYQGIPVGQITDIRLGLESSAVEATAYIINTAAHLFRRDSVIWIVQPEVGLGGIHNPEAILSGSYLEVQPGDGEEHTSFTVLSQPPPAEPAGGLNIVLEAVTRGSLKPGSPVYYRQVQIGRVTGYRLSPTAQQVWIDLVVEPGHRHLIRSTTRFWNASGLSVAGGVLSGLEVRTESLQALLAGGIALATPDGEILGQPARDGDHFPLETAAEPGWQDWQPVLNNSDAPVPVHARARVPLH